jgi:hypothetical protein
MHRAALILVLAASLTACSPKAPPGVDTAVLDEAIANSIGDPTTCVLVVKKGSGEVVYRYGRQLTCGTKIPSCQAGGTTSVDALAKEAAAGATRTVSCPSPAGGVGIAIGPVTATRPELGELAYAAAMNSAHVLPGIEIARRLDGALARGGF